MWISSYVCSFLKRRRRRMLDPSSFAYDQQVPLALEVLAERVQDGAIVRDINYASPRGESPGLSHCSLAAATANGLDLWSLGRGKPRGVCAGGHRSGTPRPCL